jgi:hypothetical protein
MIDAMNLLPCLVKAGTKTTMIDRTQVQLSVGILFAPLDGATRVRGGSPEIRHILSERCLSQGSGGRSFLIKVFDRLLATGMRVCNSNSQPGFKCVAEFLFDVEINVDSHP